ncbi:hypothetical protein SLEP1_g18961 [Rubroshorea leprosula]|uniref:Uncharacterized protein n=1 Tax=Rubroshorea leprosula TaxID=152421 RepID=A0AAV5J8F3_9ROSI|nr:hypothetical protein SLEP1_g18961 [Rubroshorea leprosula]
MLPLVFQYAAVGLSICCRWSFKMLPQISIMLPRCYKYLIIRSSKGSTSHTTDSAQLLFILRFILVSSPLI